MRTTPHGFEVYSRSAGFPQPGEGDLRIDATLGAAIVPRGAVLPYVKRPGWITTKYSGGVVDGSGQFVAGHLTRLGAQTALPEEVIDAYPCPDDADVFDETVVWGGSPGRPLSLAHFGHQITELLARLWYTLTEPGARLRVAFPFPQRAYGGHFSEILGRLGLPPERVLFLERPSRFAAVVVPDQALYLNSGHVEPRAMRRVWDTVRGPVPAPASRKVFLTQRMLPKRATEAYLFEERVEEFFRSQGFDVVAPETMPLAEQIRMIADASWIASSEGTLAHLVVFAQHGVRQTILQRNEDLSAFPLLQYELSALREADVAVVDRLYRRFPRRPNAGVVAYSYTDEWRDYARRWHHADEPATPPPGDERAYLDTWLKLMVGSGADVADRLAYTVTDQVCALAEELDAPVSGHEVSRLEALYGRGPQVSTLRQGQVRATAAATQAIARLDVARDEIRRLRADRDRLRTDRDRLRADRDRLRADRDRLRTDRDRLRADRDRLRASAALRVEREPATPARALRRWRPVVDRH